MKYLIIVFIIAVKFILIYDNSIIQFVYFDPSTTITSEKRDGVVILELTNGTKSTICMTNVYDNRNAQVICRMMNYNGGTNPIAFSIISSKTSTIGQTLFQNIQCLGTENSLELCPNFVMNTNTFLCNNHNQDLHVKCIGDYVYDKTTMNISTCTGSLSAGTQGLLSFKQNGATAYFCGINSNFRQAEATYFCKSVLCTNSAYARIVEGYPPGVNRQIGGFNSMTCSDTGCINVYPFQSDRCTPDSNIGVTCTNDSAVMYPSPIINCSSSSMTISWSATIYNASIANNFFAIKYENGSNCTNIGVGASVINTVFLTVNFGECDMIVSGTNESIIFTFRVTRMYSKANNVITTPDELFNVSCVIQRNQTVIQGPLLVQPIALPPSTGNTTIPNTLTLYTDSGFSVPINDTSTVPVGTRIFALVKLINPPPNIVLVLNRCYFGNPSTDLILNRCPALPNVQITPISDISKSFNFFLTQSVNNGLLSQVTCITSKCAKTETSCLVTC